MPDWGAQRDGGDDESKFKDEIPQINTPQITFRDRGPFNGGPSGGRSSGRESIGGNQICCIGIIVLIVIVLILSFIFHFELWMIAVALVILIIAGIIAIILLD
jgi:hypothetical protein